MELSRCASDFAIFVQALASAGGAGFPSVSALRSQLLALLETAGKLAQEAGVQPEEFRAGRFALVAWADEMILKANWAGREEWLREPLQMHVLQTNRAGDEFFDRLAALPADQLAARALYFLVLALGFEGQYQGREAERRALLQRQYETLRAAGRLLETARESQLAPAAYELEIELPRAERRLGLAALALGLSVALALVYAALWFALRSLGGEVPLPRGL
jgi:type VI secretion system protein ImpK